MGGGGVFMTRLEAIQQALDELEYERIALHNRPFTWDEAENDRAARRLQRNAREQAILETEFEAILREGREAA